MTHRGQHRGGEGGFSLVELLVVMVVTGVLGVAITNVVLSTMRTSTFTEDVRTVMDDGRISTDRIRGELREARRVLADGSTDASIRFWLDADQDGQMDPEEIVCYAVSELSGDDGYELLRWDDAGDDCDDPPAEARSVARTLVEPDGVFSYTPEPSADPDDPRTRLVNVNLLLDVRTDAGPEAIRVQTTIRLRNVE